MTDTKAKPPEATPKLDGVSSPGDVACPAGSVPQETGGRRGRKRLASIVRGVLAPRPRGEELERRLQQLRADLPAPVFWLFGKAQSGKTSIIRAITGATKAEIGEGFRSCTRTAQLYAFPSEENCFVRFLDTRGLGEVDYDPTADVRTLEAQAHCLVVVIKAMDHAQAAVLEPLKRIARTSSERPLIVVQTCLHEGYPWREPRHVVPYPYGDPASATAIPHELGRSLMAQRKWFDRLPARFVPVDFTLPEDGFDSEHYGLDALWAAVEDAVPLGLRSMLVGQRSPLRDAYLHAAMPHILSYSALAGAAALIPLPLVDIPMVAAIQVKMFHSIASVYGQPLKVQRIAEVLSALGFSLAARQGAREMLKLIPGWGSAVAGLFAAASTYAVGRTLCVYFGCVRRGELPEPAMLRRLYREQYEEGRRRLGEYLRHVGAGQPGPK